MFENDDERLAGRGDGLGEVLLASRNGDGSGRGRLARHSVALAEIKHDDVGVSRRLDGGLQSAGELLFGRAARRETALRVGAKRRAHAFLQRHGLFRLVG